MRLSELPVAEIEKRLASTGVTFQAGPFLVCLQSNLPVVSQGLTLLYDNFPVADADQIVDLRLRVSHPNVLRRWFRRQAICTFDGVPPFEPLPAHQAYALFETSLNWYIYSEVYNYLIIHAAAVERRGRVAILPALPGAGKSTLTAALVCHGWRLLTDELALISFDAGKVLPLARPISLKNRSITLIQQIDPNVVIGGECRETAKGTVAFMRPPPQSVARMNESAPPAWLIFPQYDEHSSLHVAPLPKAQTFTRLADGLVNYAILGLRGFQSLTRLIDQTESYELRYGNLPKALLWFDELAETGNVAAR